MYLFSRHIYRRITVNLLVVKALAFRQAGSAQRGSRIGKILVLKKIEQTLICRYDTFHNSSASLRHQRLAFFSTDVFAHM